MGKITVKHYLNTRGLPLILDDNKEYYAIYVQITQHRKTTQIRSFLNILSTIQGFDNYLKSGIFQENEVFAFGIENISESIKYEEFKIKLGMKFIADNKIDITLKGHDLKDVLELLFEPARKILIDYFSIWIMVEDMEKSDFSLYNILNQNNTLYENIEELKRITNLDISLFVNKKYLELSKDLTVFLNQIKNISYIELININIDNDIDFSKMGNKNIIIEYIELAINTQISHYMPDTE